MMWFRLRPPLPGAEPGPSVWRAAHVNPFAENSGVYSTPCAAPTAAAPSLEAAVAALTTYCTRLSGLPHSSLRCTCRASHGRSRGVARTARKSELVKVTLLI